MVMMNVVLMINVAMMNVVTDDGDDECGVDDGVDDGDDDECGVDDDGGADDD